MIPRAFLDASVLFAAAGSETGASREILHLGLRGSVEMWISDIVIEETRRNLALKLPDGVPIFEELLDRFPFAVIIATARQVRAAAVYTEAKDAPIVAAARRAKAAHLVTFDREHLIDRRDEIEPLAGLKIVLPEEALYIIRRGGEQL